jgi:hypothetical protein
MKPIKNLNTSDNGNHKFEIFPKSDDFDEINIHVLNDVVFTGSSLYYPNLVLYSKLDNTFYQPLEESTMSLRNINSTDKIDYKVGNTTETYKDPVFYFIYNTDNYYHFIYDTLPYLISYKKLKIVTKNLKLLMYYSHGDKFYTFVTEFLEILKIDKSDVVILNKDTMYSRIYISSTYTYGSDPKQQPREEIYDLYKEIVQNVKELNIEKQFPKKFYISRRSWIHNDFSNIGTNYTTRRKCKNENELVDLLKSQGYEEIFTEKLSTVYKILLFNNAESIVSAIGGGIVNVLFSKPLCKLITLVSPTFLDVNYRFTYSLNKVNTYYFWDTKHTESSEFKQFMRVQSENVVGEIEEVLNDEILVKYSDEKITGWNASMTYKTMLLKKEKCKKLDNGLNCSWSLNLETLKNII